MGVLLWDDVDKVQQTICQLKQWLSRNLCYKILA